MPKRIRLSGQARDQLEYRGGNEEEVIEAIATSPWDSAEMGRFECRKVFSYNKEWNRKWYLNKEVRPIFADEENEIVVVTVYVYYR